MKLLIKLAFRNILRNRRRTLITGAVMTIGLAGLIFIDAFLMGLIDTMIHSATSTFLADFQIHREKGPQSSLDSTIAEYDALADRLQKKSEQISFSPRIVTQGMVSAAEYSFHVRIYGVNVQAERKTSELLGNVVTGEVFTDELSEDPEVLIGERLALYLNVRLGDHLVLVSSGAAQSGMVQERFKIRGIFRSGTKKIDQYIVLMNHPTAKKFFHLKEKEYQEIALHTLDPKLRSEPSLFSLAVGSNEIQSWRQLIPALDAGITVTGFSRMVYSIILLFLTLLTVTNAVFMSIYERLYEMGVIKAIGTRSRSVFLLIMLESFFLSLLSAVMGVLLGSFLIFIFQKTGVPFGEVEFFGASIHQRIIPLFQARQFYKYPFFIICVAQVAALYPAIYASRINPLLALRRE